MSRAPPFPTRDSNRARNNAPSSFSVSAYDSRPQSIVSDVSGADSRNSAIPTRPSRSQLRGMPGGSDPRINTAGLGESQRGAGVPPPVVRTRPLRRDSGSTTFSDREGPSPATRRDLGRDRDWDRGASTDVDVSRRRVASPTAMSPDESTSPRALAAINAFRNAGRTRARRQGTLESPGTAGLSTAGLSSAGFSSPGGFGSPEELEREEAERRRQEERRLDEERRQRMMGRQQDRQRTGGRGGRGDIDVVLDQIQGEWEFVSQPNFNPVDLALQLLDENTMGKDMQSFRSTKRILERALKGSIQKYAQTFAAALPHHATVMSSLTTTQTSIQDSKTALLEMKESLGNRRADLAQLWTRGQTLDEMIKIVDEIEYLKTVPDTLESLISEKKLLQASSLLLKATKIIGKADMHDIGALGDLKAYLSGQETTLREILVDELQAHMYLKTFWCDTRWHPYVAGQQMLPAVEFDDEKRQSLTTITSPRSTSSRLATYLHTLNIKPNDSYEARTSHILATTKTDSLPNGTNLNTQPFTNGNTFSTNEAQNPESDSFSYIEMILESLSILGKLGVALESVTQRLPMELYSLVEATVDEVDERTEFSRRLMAGGMSAVTGAAGGRESVVAAKTGVGYIYVDSKRTAMNAGSATAAGNGATEQSSTTLLRLSALENSASNADHEVLRDLFWTLYSKMDAVCQSIRVVYEVANRIGTRKDFRDSSGAKPGSLFPFPDLWAPIEAELKGLILIHLTVEKGGASTGRKHVPSITDVLSSAKSTRDKGWQNFRFGDSDTKLANRLNKQHEEELTRLLKDSVPGLVAGTETQVQSALSTAVDDRFASAVPHRLLVSPDAFYVSVLFHPTLAFLDRVADVLPETTGEGVRESSSFLDEFVLRVYLPLLEERVASLFLKIVTSPDAFFPDPGWKRLSTRPLVKAATELMALINSLCAMQQTTPFHRDNYSRLILGVVIQFYQRCSDRFRELVSTSAPSVTGTPSTPKLGASTDEAHVAVAARWAQKLEVAACVSALYALSDDDVVGSRRLCRQETRVELNFLTTETVNRDDLVPSKNLHALGNLFHSLIWFMRQLVSMRLIVNDPLSPVADSNLESETGFTAVTPHFPLLPPAPPSDELKLPLTKPMALRFDALMRTYEQLAEYVLATLRIDTRCRTIHFLDLAMRRGNYRVDRDAGDPDPHIMDLNLDLGVCDDCANETLPPKERKFLFEGLGTLMEHLLISNARHIRFANAVGIQKIMRNMLAMQQNMKTITDASQDADFERAKVYYSLFSLTPQEMLASIRRRAQFTLEEYKSMLNFQCGVDQALGERGAMNATDRNYNAYVTELHALAIEESTD